MVENIIGIVKNLKPSLDLDIILKRCIENGDNGN